MRGISPAANPIDHEPAPPLRRPQRLLGVRAADGVDDHVGAAAGELLGARLAGLPSCSRCRRPRRTSRTARASRATTPPRSPSPPMSVAELDRGQPDAAGGAEHEHVSPGCRSAIVRSVCIAVRVRHAERGRVAQVDRVGDHVHAGRVRRRSSRRTRPRSWRRTRGRRRRRRRRRRRPPRSTPGELAARARTAPAPAPGTRRRRSARRGSSPPRTRCRRAPRPVPASGSGSSSTATTSGGPCSRHDAARTATGSRSRRSRVVSASSAAPCMRSSTIGPNACSFSSSPARWKPCSSTTASFHLARTM